MAPRTGFKLFSCIRHPHKETDGSMGNSQTKAVILTDEVQLDHFKLLRVVGKGAFGKVRIVERRDTGLTFALKYIRKDEVVRSENVRNIVRERRMMEHLNHPFLCNLRYSFQDYEYLYLVVDLMSGGDLRFHISRKTFTEDAIRFWMAELGSALEYIHLQGVVHRDVKPDNVLLDTEGHIHLTDFNVASEVTPNKPLTSKSGTLAYLAPEVYEGKGYSSEVDWWSLGVVFYECIYGRRPFSATSHEELAHEVKTLEPRYPTTSPLVSTACSSAIRMLLEKKVRNRIGANDFSTFTQHPFFRQYDFESLVRKEYTPVFRPSSDKTNFDATYDLEELLLEEAPLEARARHQKPRAPPKPNASPQEKRAADLYNMIERLFEPFDYTSASFDKIVPEAKGSVSLQSPHETHTIDALQCNTGVSPVSSNPASASASASSTTPTSEVTFRSKHQPVPHRNRTASPADTGSGGSPPLTGFLSNPLYQSQFPNHTKSVSAAESRTFKRAQQKSLSKTTSGTGTTQSTASSKSPNRPRGVSRTSSAGHVRSTNTSSSTTPTTGASNAATTVSIPEKGKRGVLLGLLGSSRRGREKSPKRAENGVLGKDGARHVISWE